MVRTLLGAFIRRPESCGNSTNARCVRVSGQKCSAASRAYIPDTIWPQVKKELLADLAEMKMGDPRDFKNFTGAVIDEKSFDKIARYIDALKKDKKNIQIIAGGKYDKSKGYFIEPTVAVSKDPKSVTMCEEIFGPVLTIHVYNSDRWMDTLELVDSTGEYALTGSVISNDRNAVLQAVDVLRHAAGNFYINDKPTGAVVGHSLLAEHGAVVRMIKRSITLT